MDRNKENELVAKIITNRDKHAFGLIYEEYVDRIYKFVFLRVGNKSWAEEITSDTFFVLLDSLVNFRQESSLKNYIYSIANNKIKQFWHVKSQRHEVELDDEAYILEDDDTDSAQEIRGISDKVMTVLNNLSANYRNVLECRFIKSKSIKETSQILAISEANVRVIQNRALKTAKALLINEIKHGK